MRVAYLVVFVALCHCGLASKPPSPDFIDCDDIALIGTSQVKCKPRTGPAMIPDADSTADALENLLNSILNINGSNETDSDPDVQFTEYAEHVMQTYSQMLFAKMMMQENQKEIDLVAQHLLPATQRQTLQHSASAEALRTNVQVAKLRLHDVSQSVPRDVVTGNQQRYANIISTLHTMRNQLLRSENKDSQDNTGENSLLSTSIASKNLHQAVNENWDGQVTFLQQSGGLKEKVVSTLDQLLDSYKALHLLERDQQTKQRVDWTDTLERINDDMENIITAETQQRTEAYITLNQSQKFKAYLKKLTSQQYGTLGWYNTLQSHLKDLGKHMDIALVKRAATIPLIQNVLHLLRSGDVPFTRPAVNGCDGFGSSIDACGVCRGNNMTCLSCDLMINGESLLDVCGVCGDGKAHDCSYFCDNKPNSGRAEDLCGVCDGRDVMCAGCDSIPHSSWRYDTCGVCHGDGQSCAHEKGCSPSTPCTHQVSCPFGKQVTSQGYRSCCFDPAFDCVDLPLSM